MFIRTNTRSQSHINTFLNCQRRSASNVKSETAEFFPNEVLMEIIESIVIAIIKLVLKETGTEITVSSGITIKLDYLLIHHAILHVQSG